MIDGLIPRRYAKALYKFALEKGNTKEVYDEMKSVIDAFRANPDFQKILSNPYVKRGEKEKLLVAAAGKDVEDDYRRFVKLVLDHKREDFAYMMAYSFRDIYREANKISQVKITTAAALPEAEMEKLRALVQKSFPGRTLEFSDAIDESLIGGFVIDVDSARMDASVSNELTQLRQNLITTI